MIPDEFVFFIGFIYFAFNIPVFSYILELSKYI